MDKFAVIEVGSTNTKRYLYDNGNIKEYPQVTITLKWNYKKHGHLLESDIKALCSLVNDMKKETQNVFIYGTSIFRELKGKELTDFLKTLKDTTGCNLNIVTPEQESEYTVKGVLLGNDYKGKLAIMIGGGGSTEVCIVENKKIIEKKYSNYGVTEVCRAFEQINNHKPNFTLKEVDKWCLEQTTDIENKADILVLAGGDYKYFYECAGKEFLDKNKFYKDGLQPYSMTMENINKVDKRFVLEQDIQDYIKNDRVYNDQWWLGTRGMRFCVRAVANKCGAK